MSKQPTELNFPEGFLWGAATSAYQIEGGITNDWSEWEKKNSVILSKKYTREGKRYLGWDYLKEDIQNPANYLSGDGVDHWNRWESDFKLLSELGLKGYRMSIEWARVEPVEGEFDFAVIDKYAQMLYSLRAQGIEPMVTLWHFTLPTWVADIGGWENKQTIEYFDRFAQQVVSKCPQNTHWITLNEPEIYTREAYLTGKWPPGRRAIGKYFGVIGNLIDAHKKASRVIRQANPNALVGIAKNNTYFQPYKDRLINKLAVKPVTWWWNRYFLNRIHKDLDFIGLNYYFHRVVNFPLLAKDLDPISEIGVELGPHGIYHTLKELRRYKLPVYVTENGLADSTDEHRKWFIKQSVVEMHSAMQDGVDLRGYFHWSLLDNFEWDKGYWARFGLYSVNRETMQREMRESAKYYSEIVRSNSVKL